MQSIWQKRYMRYLLAITMIAGIGALSSYAYLNIKSSKYLMIGPMTINVMGEGEVFAKPDIGTFSFSVKGEGALATDAQNQSAESMKKIIAFVKAKGVKEKDIKTENYSLNPKYRYEERFCISNSYCPPGEQILDGYEVYQQVTVKVRDLEQAGDLMSGVGGGGATNISGLSFTIDDPDVLKSQARELAIKDAREKAKTLAQELGVRIVKMTNYYENEGSFPTPYYGDRGGEIMMEKSMNIELSLVVPVGENEIKSQVTITYEVK